MRPQQDLASFQTLKSLASDIVGDAQTLVTQHGSLLKAEVIETRNRSVMAGVLVGAGIVGLVVGLLFVLIGIVHLVAWAFPTLPYWAAWLICGGVLCLLSALSAFLGIRTLSTLEIVPHRTLRSLKESWSCLLNRLN